MVNVKGYFSQEQEGVFGYFGEYSQFVNNGGDSMTMIRKDTMGFRADTTTLFAQRKSGYFNVFSDVQINFKKGITIGKLNTR